MSLTVGIFEMTTSNALRYNSELLSVLEKNGAAVKIFVDDENDCSSSFQVVSRKYWSIERLTEEIRGTDVVVINAQRIPDYMVVCAAESALVPVVYLMHGLYVPHMKREISFYLKAIGKSLRYFCYAFMIGIFLKSWFLSVKMILNFIFGYPSRQFLQRFDKLQVTVALIWAETWQAWHEENWFMAPEKGWTTIGNPDLARFSWKEPEKNTICYVYQTLVEDGRIEKELMIKFYSELKRFSDSNNLHVKVKWHPRGSEQLKSILHEHNFSIVDDGSIPVGDMVIGHYSSLLGAFPLKSVPVLIVELPGHKTPVSIVGIASRVVCWSKFSSTEIQIPHLVHSQEAKKNSERYFGKEPDYVVIEKVINDLLDR